MNHWDYIEAGLRVFGLHPLVKNLCGCGDPDCKMAGKHPRISGWQNTPAWSDEQLDIMEQSGQFATGFGVLCRGLIVIDIDPRNGGDKSFLQLCQDHGIDYLAEAAFAVQTGGGGQHLYYRAPEGVALQSHLREYPGIDFKSSGYVVGCGSLHASGGVYEALHGHPCDIQTAPTVLVKALDKPKAFRADYDGKTVDWTHDDLRAMLSCIQPSCGYDDWIRVGMALHHVTGGTGLALWDDWSSAADNYAGSEQIGRHWHSFGKSTNLATGGTLHHLARAGGYVQPVTFEYYEQPSEHAAKAHTIDTSAIDLKRPPGFVGELTQWINDQCLYPRESLSVAAALAAVSCLAGMRIHDELDGMAANIVAFCVAGSGTGKEAVQQAFLQIMKTAGIQGAVHGGIKSEQEIYRNLIRHQAAFYSVDELGIMLRKLDNASKRGGASYLEGVIGTIMSVYSKAAGYLPVTGDLKAEIKEILIKEAAKIQNQISNLGKTPQDAHKLAYFEREAVRVGEAIDTVDNGIERPFLTILGYTTPVTFNDLVTFEQATNGFIARAMIFNDLETNPRRKPKFSKRAMPTTLAAAITALWRPGYFDQHAVERVEYRGTPSPVHTTPEAAQSLEDAYDHFHDQAEEAKSINGMEAIPRRGYELTAKVSLLLAAASGVRTVEHVQWAFALAKRDISLKTQLAYGTENKDNTNGVMARVLSQIDEHGQTLGVLANKLRPTSKVEIEKALAKLVEIGRLTIAETKGENGRTYVRYYPA